MTIKWCHGDFRISLHPLAELSVPRACFVSKQLRSKHEYKREFLNDVTYQSLHLWFLSITGALLLLERC